MVLNNSYWKLPWPKPTSNEKLSNKKRITIYCKFSFKIITMPDQDLGPRSSKKTKYQTEYNVQVAKGYICTVKYKREKRIKSTLTTFENQELSTSPFFIIRMHFH